MNKTTRVHTYDPFASRHRDKRFQSIRVEWFRRQQGGGCATKQLQVNGKKHTYTLISEHVCLTPSLTIMKKSHLSQQPGPKTATIKLNTDLNLYGTSLLVFHLSIFLYFLNQSFCNVTIQMPLQYFTLIFKFYCEFT